MIMITHSAQETVRLGQELAKELSEGDVVALYGELGSGKTTFTKGVGKGLGVKDARRINSPTFVLAKEYEARISLYHLDLYRLGSLQDIEDIAVEEYVYGDGVTVIEWAEKMKGLLPKNHLAVTFAVKGRDAREIKIEDFRH